MDHEKIIQLKMFLQVSDSSTMKYEVEKKDTAENTQKSRLFHQVRHHFQSLTVLPNLNGRVLIILKTTLRRCDNPLLCGPHSLPQSHLNQCFACSKVASAFLVH